MKVQTAKHLRIALVIAAISVICMAGMATASTVIRMALPQLVQQADSIIQGRVDHTEVKWEQNLAVTYIYVTVEDPMKGARRSTVVIRQLGGNIGAMHVEVSGMPKFSTGEEVILFLQARRDGNFQVLGMNQGKYQITDDYAVSNVSGINVYNPTTGRIETPAFVEKAPVEALKSKIRELMK